MDRHTAFEDLLLGADPGVRYKATEEGGTQSLLYGDAHFREALPRPDLDCVASVLNAIAERPWVIPALLGPCEPPVKPKVITLCGSSRFIDVMAVCGWLLEREEGAVVLGLHLLPGWYFKTPVPDHLAEHEGVAGQMDALHLKKIEMSDEVFVVNVNDYIGQSTMREIEHAIGLKKTVRWFTHDPIGDLVREIGTASAKEQP